MDQSSFDSDEETLSNSDFVLESNQKRGRGRPKKLPARPRASGSRAGRSSYKTEEERNHLAAQRETDKLNRKTRFVDTSVPLRSLPQRERNPPTPYDKPLSMEVSYVKKKSGRGGYRPKGSVVDKETRLPYLPEDETKTPLVPMKLSVNTVQPPQPVINKEKSKRNKIVFKANKANKNESVKQDEGLHAQIYSHEEKWTEFCEKYEKKEYEELKNPEIKFTPIESIMSPIILKPRIEWMKDHMKFICFLEYIGLDDSGLVKVIPPPGYITRMEGYDQIDNLKFEYTVMQTAKTRKQLGPITMIRYDEIADGDKTVRDLKDHNDTYHYKIVDSSEDKKYNRMIEGSSPLISTLKNASLFDEDVELSLRGFRIFLGEEQMIENDKHRDGSIFQPMLSAGTRFALDCFHSAPTQLASVVYNHIGASRIFSVIPPMFATKFVQLMKELAEVSYNMTTLCESAVLHNLFLVHSEEIQRHMPVIKVDLNEGEFIFFAPATFKNGINEGFNIIECMNIPTTSWIHHGLTAPTCVIDNCTTGRPIINVDMSPFIDYYFEDLDKEEWYNDEYELVNYWFLEFSHNTITGANRRNAILPYPYSLEKETKAKSLIIRHVYNGDVEYELIRSIDMHSFVDKLRNDNEKSNIGSVSELDTQDHIHVKPNQDSRRMGMTGILVKTLKTY